MNLKKTQIVITLESLKCDKTKKNLKCEGGKKLKELNGTKLKMCQTQKLKMRQN